MKRSIVIILDGVGVGELPDASLYADAGSNTLHNVACAVGGLRLPNLKRMGLGNIIPFPGVSPCTDAVASYAIMAAVSPGKDTITGHWELMGVQLKEPFRTYPDGFPDDLVALFERAIGRKTLGKKPASGTEVIERYGAEHMRTGWPIIYTSADSVFQIACHEQVVPLEQLYEYCAKARQILSGEHLVARVIARPFVGVPGSFKRTPRRKDYSLPPPGKTLLDCVSESGQGVLAIGKIDDIFAGRGMTMTIHTSDNSVGILAIIKALSGEPSGWGLLLANLVDFDMLYGHRKDAHGFARTLEQFDDNLPEILGALQEDDILMITADHGCDPTTPGTDHTREYVPLIVYGKSLARGVNLGVRDTFSDAAASLAEFMGLLCPLKGTSFMPLLRR